MAGLNKVMLIGNLGRDPETRRTSGDRSVTEFSLATSESWNDREGNRQERTEWHRIVVWGPLGELCARYLTKGRQVAIEGSIKYRKYEDKEGVEKYATDIVASNVVFLSDGGRRGGEGGAPPQGGGSHDGGGRNDDRGSSYQPSAPEADSFSGDDDIPF
jgi:single-strand DNA-binding protein